MVAVRRMADCFVTLWTRNLLSEKMVESHTIDENGRMFCNILDKKITVGADVGVP
jgi:hypothetical protein